MIKISDIIKFFSEPEAEKPEIDIDFLNEFFRYGRDQI